MTAAVRYTEEWNRLLMQPIEGCGWLNEDEARALYEQRPGRGVMVVGGEEDGDGFVPLWVLGFGAGSGVRAQFFDRQGSLRRLVDYDGLDDGRLRRWITNDYTYPDQARRWAQNQSILTMTVSVETDGSGWYVTLEKADPTATRPVRTSTPINVPIAESWLVDRPAFGDWARLADPGPSAWEVAGQSVPTRTS